MRSTQKDRSLDSYSFVQNLIVILAAFEKGAKQYWRQTRPNSHRTRDASHTQIGMFFPLMLLACSVNTPIDNNRSHLLVLHMCILCELGHGSVLTRPLLQPPPLPSLLKSQVMSPPLLMCHPDSPPPLHGNCSSEVPWFPFFLGGGDDGSEWPVFLRKQTPNGCSTWDKFQNWTNLETRFKCDVQTKGTSRRRGRAASRDQIMSCIWAHGNNCVLWPIQLTAMTVWYPPHIGCGMSARWHLCLPPPMNWSLNGAYDVFRETDTSCIYSQRSPPPPPRDLRLGVLKSWKASSAGGGEGTTSAKRVATRERLPDMGLDLKIYIVL